MLSDEKTKEAARFLNRVIQHIKDSDWSYDIEGNAVVIGSRAILQIALEVCVISPEELAELQQIAKLTSEMSNLIAQNEPSKI